MAEGMAMALDIFDELESKHGMKRGSTTRHVVLISSMPAYEDFPVIESKNYRGLQFEEIVQNLIRVIINWICVGFLELIQCITATSELECGDAEVLA